ncbi:V-type ATP synthase subunit E family protein [Halodesulfovibrio sp.]|uniref:FliH/SctL family protein n=1 Tax=Halodesulfovibrio sp. TaxID=1912772 RepID=UPI0025F434CA|nr:V-type ATP synthase subunit E family protein [Halodesulfovibrio sp.]MCT4536426.1 V-type ATP synthase subunit E family protein [Halodesulfovibrio sp.]
MPSSNVISGSMLSDTAAPKSVAAWGTIFTGPGSANEHTLEGVEGSRSPQWDDATEAIYMERVRERAAERASGILAKAREEAEWLKEKARQEGYAEGCEQAQAELNALQQQHAESVSSVLGAIQGQCSNIFTNWRSDLITVVQAAVERMCAVEMSENRHASMERLFTEAVQILDERRQLIITVHPEDEELVTGIIQNAQQHYSGLEGWKVKTSSTISGGVIVESRDGMVDNTIVSRRQAVDEILEQLMIPEDQI